ncbi:hypothetical protein ACLESD_36985, partial [Pyxidicoccus sp. 3LFB2]
MMRSFRLIRVAVLGLALAWTAPTYAQSFEGLDLGAQSKKKKKGATSSKKKKQTSRKTRGGKATPAPAPEEAPSEATASDSPASEAAP